GQVHDTEFHVQHLVVAKFAVLLCSGVLDRVVGIDTVDLRCLQHQVGVDLDAAQAGGRIRGEEGVAGTGGENCDVAVVQVADRRAAIVVLDHSAHRDRRHDAGRDAGALQGVAHGQGVHHRGQHAHVVTGDAFHARLVQGLAAEQVATANYKADLDTD